MLARHVPLTRCAASLPRTPPVSYSHDILTQLWECCQSMVEQHLWASTVIHVTSVSHESRDLYNSRARKLRPEKVFSTETLTGRTGLWASESGFLFAVKQAWDLREVSKWWKCIQNSLCISQYCDKDERLWNLKSVTRRRKNQSVVSFQTGLRETLLSAAQAEGKRVEQIPKPSGNVFYLCSSTDKDQVQYLTLGRT